MNCVAAKRVRGTFATRVKGPWLRYLQVYNATTPTNALEGFGTCDASQSTSVVLRAHKSWRLCECIPDIRSRLQNRSPVMSLH